jgi:hypothetical protein
MLHTFILKQICTAGIVKDLGVLSKAYQFVENNTRIKRFSFPLVFSPLQP